MKVQPFNKQLEIVHQEPSNCELSIQQYTNHFLYFPCYVIKRWISSRKNEWGNKIWDREREEGRKDKKRNAEAKSWQMRIFQSASASAQKIQQIDAVCRYAVYKHPLQKGSLFRKIWCCMRSTSVCVTKLWLYQLECRWIYTLSNLKWKPDRCKIRIILETWTTQYTLVLHFRVHMS